MVNSVLNAVTKQLGTKFGSSYCYYVEDVEQGFKKPCFLVIPRIQLMRSKSPVLYDRTFPLVLHYFSDSTKNLKKDCNDKAEKIIEYLEYLPFQDTILRGEDISFQIVEDVLQVFITYKFTTRRITEIEDTIDQIAANVSNG